MEELLKIIQQDPELWELVERLKHSEQTEVEFFTQVANMLAVEFQELHRTDLRDKLSALFGGCPEKHISWFLIYVILHLIYSY